MTNQQKFDEMRTSITCEVMEACKDTLVHDFGFDMKEATPSDIQKFVIHKLEEAEHDKLFFLAGYLSAIAELESANEHIAELRNEIYEIRERE